MKKAIITSAGKDGVGITAGVCVYLAEQNANILDFSQSIVGGYYNMMVIADIENVSSYDAFVTGLNETGKNLGIDIKCQLAEIFEAMHRI
ncbi:MAG: ACT domain-containing protein [Firmicutes bacterium]|nr:ACT domain-containing protein [Bacillota bacterium]